jgi:predicted transcriptional regulator
LEKPSSSNGNNGNGIWKEISVDDLDRQQSAADAIALGAAREQRIVKRSRLERYIDILRVVNEFGPIRRTHILYKANLSWGDLEDSLTRLEEAGALQKSVSKSGVHYGITDAGKKFLSNAITVRELLHLDQTVKNPSRPTTGSNH